MLMWETIPRRVSCVPEYNRSNKGGLGRDTQTQPGPIHSAKLQPICQSPIFCVNLTIQQYRETEQSLREDFGLKYVAQI